MRLNVHLLKNLNRFRLITFDVSGTLLQYKSPGRQFVETASKYGYDRISSKKISSVYMPEYELLLEKFPNYGKGIYGMNWYRWWIKQAYNCFDAIDSEIDEDDLEKITEEIVRLYRTDHCWEHVEGCQQLLGTLKKTGKILGVISNFDPSLQKILRSMNIDHFDFIINAYDCNAMKPDRKMFDAALQKYNIPPTEALHIGNEYNADYCGASAAGWTSILISRMSDIERMHKGVRKRHLYRSLLDLFFALENSKMRW